MKSVPEAEILKATEVIHEENYLSCIFSEVEDVNQDAFMR